MVSDQKYDTKFDVLESCKLYKSKRREWTSPGRDAPRPVVSKKQHAVPQGVSMCMSYAIWCFQPIFAPLSRPKQLVSTAQLLDSRTSPYHPAGHDIVAEPNHLQTRRNRSEMLCNVVNP